MRIGKRIGLIDRLLATLLGVGELCLLKLPAARSSPPSRPRHARPHPASKPTTGSAWAAPAAKMPPSAPPAMAAEPARLTSSPPSAMTAEINCCDRGNRSQDPNTTKSDCQIQQHFSPDALEARRSAWRMRCCCDRYRCVLTRMVALRRSASAPKLTYAHHALADWYLRDKLRYAFCESASVQRCPRTDPRPPLRSRWLCAQRIAAATLLQLSARSTACAVLTRSLLSLLAQRSASCRQASLALAMLAHPACPVSDLVWAFSLRRSFLTLILDSLVDVIEDLPLLSSIVAWHPQRSTMRLSRSVAASASSAHMCAGDFVRVTPRTSSA